MQRDVFALVCVMSEGVMNQSAEERDIGSSTNRDIQIRNCSRAIEAWVDGDDFRLALTLGFYRKAKTHRVILGRITTHHQNHIRIGDVGPAVRHSPAAECGGQTGHRWAVS